MDMTPERPWTPKAVASALAMQEACLAPGRAARIATGLNASAKIVDPLLCVTLSGQAKDLVVHPEVHRAYLGG
jgi:hypothetical protein